MDFNTWKEFYEWGFSSKEQLQQAVRQDMLTKDQYKEITGEDFPTPVVEKPVVPITETTPVQPTETPNTI